MMGNNASKQESDGVARSVDEGYGGAVLHSTPLLTGARPSPSVTEAAVAPFAQTQTTSQPESFVYACRNLSAFPIDGMDALERAELINILDLSGNQLVTLPEELFSRAKRIKKLALGNNRLENLPDSLWTLSDLTWLDLTHNRISSLSEHIGSLNRLEGLGLSDCRLSVLPPSIGNCRSLVKMGLYGNRLTEIPNEIGQLTMMQKLDLSSNLLTSIPEAIGTMKRLVWLNLSRNLLQALPDTLGELVELQDLGLAENKLQVLPDLGKLKKLKILPVHGNQIREIGSWVGGLVSLEKLDLGHNQLEDLPWKEIFSLSYLTYLSIRGNKFKRISLDYGQTIPPLKIFDCNENELQWLPFELVKLPSLSDLRCTKNPLLEYQKEANSRDMDWVIREKNGWDGKDAVLSLKNLSFMAVMKKDMLCLKLRYNSGRGLATCIPVLMAHMDASWYNISNLGTLDFSPSGHAVMMHARRRCPGCDGSFHPLHWSGSGFECHSMATNRICFIRRRPYKAGTVGDQGPFVSQMFQEELINEDEEESRKRIPVSMWFCSPLCAFKAPLRSALSNLPCPHIWE